MPSLNIADWRKTKKGDIVVLKDEQTLSDLLADKNPDALRGLELTVVSQQSIRQEQGIVEWLLYELKGYEIPLFFMIKIVEDEVDIRIYYVPDDFEAGSRKDQINAGRFWLFQEPDDPDNFVPCDLEFQDQFEQDVDGGKRTIRYPAKGPPLYGESKSPGDNSPTFTTVIEYLANQPCENPECLIVEYGGMDAKGNAIPEGGHVTFMQGANINVHDIEILPV